MKLPLKWLKEYIDIPGDLKKFTDKMSMIGHLLDKLEVTGTDTVVDLELRGNRADCYSVLGIARESHAAFGGELRIPIVKHEARGGKLEDFEVVVESPVVQRFYSTVIKGLKVGPSPEWMQTRLRDYGIEPINNLVDITNYVMVETGMPMHAFDLNRMNGKKLILRQAKDGESVVTFDGGELKLTNEDCIFVAEDGSPLGIAGVIGGKESGIHEDTVDILLECAAYDRVSIRKSIFRHNSLTDAGLRHSHDLSASLCDYALARAIDLVIELAGDGDASRVRGLDDYYPDPEIQKTIEFNPKEVVRLGGIEVSVSEQVEILKRLDFEVEVHGRQEAGSGKREAISSTQYEVNSSNEMLVVKVPLFRTDISESADLVEEVLRIYGYENIPSTTLSSVIPDPVIQPELVIEEESKDILIALGLNEVITVPMAKLEDLKKTNDPYVDLAIAIINPASSEHTHMRTNMFTGLLEATRRVMDRGDEGVSFFETGKIYLKKDKPLHQPPHKPEFPYMELRKLAAAFTSKKKEWDFYKVKGVLEEYFDQLLIKNIKYIKSDHSYFDLCADIMQGEVRVGIVGLFRKDVSQKNFDIKHDVYGFVLNIDDVTNAEKTPVSFMPYSQYPAVKQDMSILIENYVQAGDLQEEILRTGGELVRNVEINDVYIMENGNRSILFSITYQSKERTLSTDEVNDLHISIEHVLKDMFGVSIRGREGSV